MGARRTIGLIGIAAAVLLVLFSIKYFKSAAVTTPAEIPSAPLPTQEPPEQSFPDPALKNEFNRLLSDGEQSKRTLDLPLPPTTQADDPHAEGRLRRKNLPMGLVLWDKAAVTKDMEGKAPLYIMRTGDIIRVYPDSEGKPRLHIHPGVDVFLAAITQNMEAAGQTYPDQDGWIDRDKVQILKNDQAIEFTQTTDPMTLSEGDFSMLSFYERAMKNPDPVVHRIIGPRLLEIVSLHEEYVSSWKSLYRDADPKIRAYSLGQLKERGVGRSGPIVEDLITRLTELTQKRASGETEIEILTIISILKDSPHSRVPAAFASFREAWAGKQSAEILDSLK